MPLNSTTHIALLNARTDVSSHVTRIDKTFGHEKMTEDVRESLFRTMNFLDQALGEIEKAIRLESSLDA